MFFGVGKGKGEFGVVHMIVSGYSMDMWIYMHVVWAFAGGGVLFVIYGGEGDLERLVYISFTVLCYCDCPTCVRACKLSYLLYM